MALMKNCTFISLTKQTEFKPNCIMEILLHQRREALTASKTAHRILAHRMIIEYLLNHQTIFCIYNQENKWGKIAQWTSNMA